MRRNLALPIAVAMIVLSGLVSPGATTTAQEKKATAQQKIASVDYLVGTWSCAHTVGAFSGKYTTTYSKVLGSLWLKQTYDFPRSQFAGRTEPAVTGEALIGYDDARGQWVRFFANSTGQYFSIRMKETGNGWSYTYVSYFGTKPEKAEADATFTKKSDTEYLIDGPTYPENGTQLTEHHSCHKL